MSFRRLKRGLFSSETTAPTAPLGAKLVSLLLGFGLLAIFAYVLRIYLFGLVPGIAQADAITVDLVLATVLVILLTAIPLLLLTAMVYGLWTAKPWGWLLYMILSTVGIVLSIVELDLLSIPIPLLLMWYIWYVRDAYGFSKRFPWTRGVSPFAEA